ncbi:MAG: tRNA (N6-threonylcarbamoyladenosine(37)-N6)-methyltransferase TrmO [Methanoregula sp.]|nr:tRNA (N6-threonylcarbamoyladenosine(37)-N6)-methyltransferase TrmO [Methanoregula sp.]
MKENTNPDAPITYTRIGTIRSPFTDVAGMPIQPTGARVVKGTVEIFEEYAEGLCDLDGFSRIILIYAFHRSGSYDLKIIPFLDTTARGVFATRAPKRPNPIGLSVVRLIGVEGRTLIIEDIDILDGTPLLDIKPYVPAFDAYPDASCGWLETAAHGAESFRSDERFR